MTDKNDEILKLSDKIAKDKFQHVSSKDIEEFLKKLRDFIINPIWKDPLILDLEKKIRENDYSPTELDDLVGKISDIIKNNSRSLPETKNFLFDEGLKKYEKRLIEVFVRAGNMKGQNEVFSSILGYLLLHSKLTQSQIQRLSGYSKGAISTNLKLFEKTGVFKKEQIEGKRKYIYSFGGDLSQIATFVGSFKAESQNSAMNFLNEKLAELNKYEDSEGQDLLHKRVNGIVDFLKLNKEILTFIMQSEIIKGLGKV